MVRALAYYDNFEARVSSDGVPMYFYYSDFVPDFATAASIVAEHPLLSDVATLMRELFANSAFVLDMMRRVQGDARAVDVERPHRDFIRDFNDRACALFDALRPRLNREILKNLDAYVEMERPAGLSDTGSTGWEDTRLVHGDSLWSARFKEGFPIGPNTATTAGGSELFVHFSQDRMRVEFDQFGVRRWIDFRSGESGSC
jgi:hypothetical protein